MPLFKNPWRSRQPARAPRIADRQALQDFSRSLALIVDPDALQSSVAARLIELFGADRLVLFFGDSGRETFVPTTAVGVADADLAGVALGRRGRLARWLLVNERCLVVPKEPGVAEYLGENEQALLSRLGVSVCAPLVSLNRLAGIVMLGSSAGEWQMTPEDLDLLALLAGQAAIALENAVLYREQRDRLQRLYRAERLAAAGELASGVAHDIRNPLTAIRSTVQYISQDYEIGSPKRALIDELLHEVDRIDRTLDGLLTLGRPRPFQAEQIDAVDVLRQSLVLLQVQATRQGVRIAEPCDGWVQAPMLGDAGELKHLFVNLVMNALQAMPDGGTLTVSADGSCSDLAGATGAVRITITDTGVGIAATDLNRIFDPFFTTKRDGTGLGLAICYGIVRRHEGEIDVASQVGKGTTVTVRLPLGDMSWRAS